MLRQVEGRTEVAVIKPAGRNVLARRAETAATMSDRTAASGRWLQPPDWAAPTTHLLAAPLRVAQRPFGSSRLGTGLVALARRPA